MNRVKVTSENNEKEEKLYQRILLKLSGEALMGSEQYGIHKQTIDRIVFQIKQVCDQNVQLAVVIGGGTFFEVLH